MPRVVEANRHEKFHREIMNEMGETRFSRLDASRVTAAPASTMSATV